jgi:hypothetical protein
MSANIPAIRFHGVPALSSGYGNATINFCSALSDSAIPTKFVLSSKRWSSDLKSFYENLNNFTGDTDIDLYLHVPPFAKHRNKNYKIGYFYWEADSLPRAWARDIVSNLNEIWVPCNLIKSACIKAGFKGPIEIVPTPCELDLTIGKDAFIPSPISSDLILSDDVFKFYSIFQWQERKGFEALLRAYYTEFSEHDNVLLILKVNPLIAPGHGLVKIKHDILKIKKMTNKKNPPKVFLITEHLSKESLTKLHMMCDCFVLPHHGEGWGIPIHHAILSDSHVIVTKFGGITESLDDDSASIIKHTLGPVKNMKWNKLYTSDQKWAYPSLAHTSQLMRGAYENRHNFSDKTNNAKNIVKSMSPEGVASTIKHILFKKRFLKRGRL